MTSLPPVKDPFNISPEEEAQVLNFFDGEFKTRFTDGDRAFQMALSKDPEEPLIVDEWVGMSGRRNHHRHKFVEDGEFRGGWRGGRGRRGRGEWRGGRGGRGEWRGRGGRGGRGGGAGGFEGFRGGRGGNRGRGRGRGGGDDGFRGRGRGRGTDDRRGSSSPGVGRGKGRGNDARNEEGSPGPGRGRGSAANGGSDAPGVGRGNDARKEEGSPGPGRGRGSAAADGGSDAPVVGVKRPAVNDSRNGSRSSSPAVKSEKVAKREDGEVEDDEKDRFDKGEHRRSEQHRRHRRDSNGGEDDERRGPRRDYDDPRANDRAESRSRENGEWKSRGPKRGRFYHRKKGYEYKDAYEDRDDPEAWPEEIDGFAAELAKARERLGLTPSTSAADQKGVKAGDGDARDDEEDSGDEDISKYDLLADERSDGEIPSD